MRFFWICVFALGMFVPPASAAVHRSQNFSVHAESPVVARQVAEAAEQLRADLARQWLDAELPRWSSACRIVVRVKAQGGNGWTTYSLLQGRVQRIQITLDGPIEHVLENILPHEIAHTVLVSCVGRLIPRWADEGIALMAETVSARLRQRKLAAQLARTAGAPSLREILTQAEYPKDRPELLAFYARSCALTEFLVAQVDMHRLLQFLDDGRQGGWDWAVSQNYGYDDVDALEAAWQRWLVLGAHERPVPEFPSVVAANSGDPAGP